MGEKLSFYKLLSEKNYIIEIPIIQRDYAQGRENEQVNEIREKFLTNLKDSLEKDQPLELDFIYGSIIPNGGHERFTPLDGQQRLTTLFLLHWYLALSENRLMDFRTLLSAGDRVRFVYETRASAREFCKALVENDIPIKEDYKISKTIEDASWFFSAWKMDPTIASMLIVIDHVDKIFGKTTFGFYDKLIDKANPLISFQFIELKDFGLTDSLYVKMNSRGKELTEFENFKARIEQHIKKIDDENGTDIYVSFSKKIDAGWTDLFWHYRDLSTNLFDNQLMNFIREMVICHYALTHGSRADDRVIRQLTDEEVKVTFSFYEQNGCLGKDCIEEISGALDHFINGEGSVRTYLNEEWMYSENELFEGAINNALTYTQRVIFYGLYKYLIQNEAIPGELFNWIRVIQNLAINTIYNDPADFARSIRSVNQLLPYSRDILTHLATAGSAVQGFADIQITEERIKALLIKKGENWKNAIYNFERHGYFRGQVDFLLSFAGIKDYYRTNDNISWGDVENTEYLKKFIEYGEKAAIMFMADGLNNFDDYLWQRALLTKGDYLLLTANKRNKCFLENGDDRDTSWKRLLRDDTSNRNIVKQLLDEINSDTVKQDLSRMIHQDNTLSWRRYFIKRPRILAECGKKMLVRFYNDYDILLLEKTQLNGRHKEYYSYALTVRLEDMGNMVEYSASSSYEEDKSIDKINDKETYIVYQDGKYWFWNIDEQYEKFDTEEEIIDCLQKKGYLRNLIEIEEMA
jgi:uncharacterized protein with ParB-like and HNH nuclease domain